MKLGNKEAGKKVYQQLINELDRNQNVVSKTLKTPEFFHLQKFLNESRNLPRILNKKHFSGLETMQWMHKLGDAGLPGDRYKKITIKRSKTV